MTETAQPTTASLRRRVPRLFSRGTPPDAVDILSRRVVASLDEVKAAARPKATVRTALVA